MSYADCDTRDLITYARQLRAHYDSMRAASIDTRADWRDRMAYARRGDATYATLTNVRAALTARGATY